MKDEYLEDEYQDDDAPIDWGKYIGTFFKYRKKIAIITIVFAILSIVVALCQKRKYTATVVLAPEVQGSSQGSGSLGDIASMFGVDLGSLATSSDAMNITVFPEIANSTPFLTQLFEVELSKKPKLPKKDNAAARKIMAGPLPTIRLYDYISKRYKEKNFFEKTLEWILGNEDNDPDYILVNPTVLTKEQAKVLKKLRKCIGVNIDKKTAMTTISVTLDDPLMCTQLADTVCRRLREYVFKYRTEKERLNFEYYEALCDSTYRKMVEAQAAYAESLDNNRSVILTKVSVRSDRLEQEANIASQVYQQMVQQREMSRAQLQDKTPVFAIVEPATMPQQPSNSRKKTCILITMIGFILASGWFVFCHEPLKNNIKVFKDKLKNDEENCS